MSPPCPAIGLALLGIIIPSFGASIRATPPGHQHFCWRSPGRVRCEDPSEGPYPCGKATSRWSRAAVAADNARGLPVAPLRDFSRADIPTYYYCQGCVYKGTTHFVYSPVRLYYLCIAAVPHPTNYIISSVHLIGSSLLRQCYRMMASLDRTLGCARNSCLTYVDTSPLDTLPRTSCCVTSDAI